MESAEAKVKEPEVKAEIKDEAKETVKAVEPTLISYDTFAKAQLRVGKIVSAEKIEKSEKLLKLQVDLGQEFGQKQILAGIAKHYDSESLIGKSIVVVANMKPAKLMGIESQGMLLAASDAEGNLELINPVNVTAPGSVVR